MAFIIKLVFVSTIFRTLIALVIVLQGKYDDAEPLFKRCYATLEETLGPRHPHVAKSLNKLALLLKLQVT